LAVASYHKDLKANSPRLERRRAALLRRSAALRAPTDPAGEAAFLGEFEAIEREAAEVEAAYEMASGGVAAPARR
jgi:hypothetical protein